VSPHTGALFVLVLDDGEGSAILRSWTNESIDVAWLDSDDTTPAPAPSNTLTFPFPFINLQGAVMLSVTLNGRYLFIVDAGAGVVRVVDVAAFSDITPTIDSEGNPVAVFTSRDSEYLYVLWHKLISQGGEDVDYARLTRYAIVSSEGSFDLVLDGSGGEWPAMPIDLAVSPDERWAYVLKTLEDQSWVQTVAIDEVASPAEPALDALLGTREKISGQASYQRLAVLNGQLYAAADDEATDVQPERGLVAVLDVKEAACDILFTKALDGCPTCAEGDSAAGNCVVVAHIPSYRHNARIQDLGEAAEGENEIDNLTHRHLLPSTHNITEVIHCMLEQGIAEGIPGPRGPAGPRGPGFQEVALAEPPPVPGSDPTVALETIPGDEEGDLRLVLGIPAGEDGKRGPGVTAVKITTLEAGSDATAVLLPIPGDPEGDFGLILGIPAGGDGEDGARGPGIVDVEVTTLSPDSAATASLAPIPGDPEGDQILQLGVPRGQPGPIDELGLTHIRGLSWEHDQVFSRDEFLDLVVDPEALNEDHFGDEGQAHANSGLVIAFDQPVDMKTVFKAVEPETGDPPIFTHSQVFQLYVRHQVGDFPRLFCECVVPDVIYQPVIVAPDGPITTVVTLDPREPKASAVRIVFENSNALEALLDQHAIFQPPSLRKELYLRVVLRSDFVLDAPEGEDPRAIDGNHLGGILPTGNGRQGGTFESWFTVEA
jgi:hypothetical protein